MYLNIDVRFQKVNNKQYRIKLSSDDGESEIVATGIPNYRNGEKFWEQISRFGQPVRSAREPQDIVEVIQTFGSTLFTQIFSKENLELFNKISESASQKRIGLRLRLDLYQTPEIADLPWELMCHKRSFIGLNPMNSIVRYSPSAIHLNKISLPAPLRVLVTIANPGEKLSRINPLDVEGERKQIEDALRDYVKSNKVELTIRDNFSLDDLRGLFSQSLQSQMPYHIWHFIGHGIYDDVEGKSYLVFSDPDTGAAIPVSGYDIGMLVQGQRDLRLVVLNACLGARSNPKELLSGVAQNLLDLAVPVVVGMQIRITDSSAKTFSKEFYSNLINAAGPIDQIVTESRRAIYAQASQQKNYTDWVAPVLFMQTDSLDISVEPAKDNFISLNNSKINVIKERTILPEMLEIDAGEFFMGASELENGYPYERPQHPITLSGYFISKSPITVAQFRSFIEAKHDGYDNEKLWLPSGLEWKRQNLPPNLWLNTDREHEDQLPMVSINWFEAMAYCNWLSSISGSKYRLPSEAQWEKAAKGPTTNGTPIYPWGNRIPDSTRCNFNNSGSISYIGQYSPLGDSYYKCVDMSGNVSEWTLSKWGMDYRQPSFLYPYSRDDDRESDVGLERRIIRGGSWRDLSFMLRCSARASSDPFQRSPLIGFRVIRGL